MKLRHSLVYGLFLLLVGGCVSNTKLLETRKYSDQAKPNYGSIYYYLVGNLFSLEGEYEVADLLWIKARNSDPHSYQINKQLLLNTFRLHEQELIEAEAVRGAITNFDRDFLFDEELLNALYEFYDAQADTTPLEQTVKLLRRSYPSARAEIQAFVFDLKYRNRLDLAYLDKALAQAGSSPQDLYLLSRLYSYYNPAREKETLLRYHNLVSSPTSHAMVVEYVCANSDTTLARDYLSTLSAPEDLEQIRNFASSLLATGNHGILAGLAPELFAADDLELLHSLSLSALMSGRRDILARSKSLLEASPAPDEDKQALRAVLIAHLLHSDSALPLSPELDKLFEAQSFEDVYISYVLAVEQDFPTSYILSSEVTHDHYRQRVLRSLGENGYAGYFLDLAKAARDSDGTALAEIKARLLLDLRQRHSLTIADYQFLLNRLFQTGEMSLRREILLEALDRHPYHADFCNDLGYTLLLEGGDLAQAGMLIERAVAIDPANPFYLDSLAWYHYLRGDPAEALRWLEIPSQMENMPAEIAWHFGAVHYALGDFDQARLYLERCLAIGEDPESSAQAEHLLKLLP